MKKLISISLSVVMMMTLIMAMAGCSPQAEENNQTELQNITFTLDWFPNTNHTGIYVAKAKGYFEEEGFDVEIIQPGESSAEQLVATGTAQFGISYQESTTFARAEGIPVVSVAAVIQHNTSGFMSLKEKGINSPKDFEGKKYGGWGSPIELATIQVLMEQENADSSKVDIVTIGDIDFFAASQAGDVDFSWVFEGWSVLEANIKGFDVQYIDLGKEAEVFDYYTPIIITSEKNITDNKEMVEKFMRAAKKGYEYAVENPEDSARILLESVPELSEELVFASQAFLSSRYIDDAPYWGYQEKETWDRYTQWLFDHAFIDTMIDSEDAFTNEFLE